MVMIIIPKIIMRILIHLPGVTNPMNNRLDLAEDPEDLKVLEGLEVKEGFNQNIQMMLNGTNIFKKDTKRRYKTLKIKIILRQEQISQSSL